MAGILGRKILMGRGADGYMRVSDWCQVTTSVGGAWETFSFNRGALAQGEDFSWKDQLNLINDTMPYDPNCQIFDERTIGGPLGMPLDSY